MIYANHALLLIVVMAVITMLLRFLPFLLFQGKTPKVVLYLGNVLPYSIIAMLVVYCLKDIIATGDGYGIPEGVAILLVAVLHKWKHNMLLSILSGTICYMFLIQVMF